jgi:hypothetical protein
VLDGSTARVAIDHDYPAGAGTTWFTRWRVDGESTWTVATHSDVAGAGTLLTEPVPLDSTIEVAVAYTGSGGRQSGWSVTEEADTTTAGLAPAPNTGFSVTDGTGSFAFEFSNSTSTNFGHSELWAAPTTDFDDAAQVGTDFSGPAGSLETGTITTAAGTYYVWSLAFNAADSASSRVGPLTAVVV